jgi:hypothetical protein
MTTKEKLIDLATPQMVKPAISVYNQYKKYKEVKGEVEREAASEMKRETRGVRK